jgi:hypothetical protein
VQRLEFGLEYFEGDFEDMRDSIMSIVKTDKMKYRESQQEKKDAEVSNAKADLKMKETELKIKEAELNIKEVELRVEAELRAEEKAEELKEKLEKLEVKKTITTQPQQFIEKKISNKTCPTCQKTFNNAWNYNYHINRKKPCVSPGFVNDNAPIKKYKCARCEAMFQTNQNLTTHLNRKFPCKIKNPILVHILCEKLKEKHLHQNQKNNDLKIQIDNLMSIMD